MSYPLRYPLSWLLALLGVNISIEIEVVYDEEANVYIATSKDIEGLILEVDNLNDLRKEVTEAIPNLLSFSCKKSLPKNRADVDVIYRDHIAAI